MINTKKRSVQCFMSQDDQRSIEETLQVFEQEKKWCSQREEKLSGMAASATVWELSQQDITTANPMEEHKGTTHSSISTINKKKSQSGSAMVRASPLAINQSASESDYDGVNIDLTTSSKQNGLESRMLALSHSATTSQLRHNHPSSPAVQKTYKRVGGPGLSLFPRTDQYSTRHEANISEISEESEDDSDESKSRMMLMYSHQLIRKSMGDMTDSSDITDGVEDSEAELSDSQ